MCVPPHGVHGNLDIYIKARGSYNHVTPSSPQLSYAIPVLDSVNMTWGVQGGSIAVLGDGFVDVPLILCKYEGQTNKPLYGEFRSSRLVVCPLGSPLEKSHGEFSSLRVYVSQDGGERWSSAVSFRPDAAIRWHTGLENVIPRDDKGAPPEVKIGGLFLAGIDGQGACERAFRATIAETNADKTVLPFTQIVASFAYGAPNFIGLAQEENVVAIIGAEYSSIALQVSPMAVQLHMPLISPSAWSARLSDPTEHPFFVRTCPSNRDIAGAAGVVLAHFKWTKVVVLASTETYADDLATGVESACVSANSGDGGECSVVHSARFDDSGASEENLDATTQNSIVRMVENVARTVPDIRVFFVESGTSGLRVVCREILRVIQSVYAKASLSSFGFVVGGNCAEGLTHATDMIGVGVLAVTDFAGDLDVQAEKYCADAVRTLARALDNAMLNPRIPRVSRLTVAISTRADRALFMNEIRMTNIHNAVSGVGRLRFNNDDNNRDPKTLSFVMTSLVHTSPRGGAALTPVADITSTSLSLLPGTILVWPGDDLTVPLSTGRDSIPKEVRILVLDQRDEFLAWATKAAVEINAMIDVLPHTQLTVETVNYEATDDGYNAKDLKNFSGLVEAFLDTSAKEQTPVIAIVSDYSPVSTYLHDAYAVRMKTFVVISAFAQSRKLNDVARFPCFVRAGTADPQHVTATFNLIDHLDFRRAIVLRNNDSRWSREFCGDLEQRAQSNDIDLRIVDCSVTTANNMSWSTVADHSKLIVLGLEFAGFPACVKSAAAWGRRAHGNEKYFQYVLPYAQWAFGAFNLATDVELGRLFDGSVGPGITTTMTTNSPRYAEFSDFWIGQRAQLGATTKSATTFNITSSSPSFTSRLANQMFSASNGVNRPFLPGQEECRCMT